MSSSRQTGRPKWMCPPRLEGWFAEDLDQLPEAAPRHIELIDGDLVVRSPQRVWHARAVTGLQVGLTAQAPTGMDVEREMTILLDKRNRLEPDILATGAPCYEPNRTFYTPDQVLLVVEVVDKRCAPRRRSRSSSI
ncbi:hypothetical protein HH310_04275 [Actinoplanes sp. TBRC 11911]|uniref:Uma2 family endonuclease n=1 Tax=Actinoplanes sp. TBRC 11911 TaxID=2729386 RepID=UPI00145EAA87|nr:Uma2 family endonuclease [Actinoplanes sp. TBRC 11911]NMO50408.1 hypothetical protein [Actinoplanes sp. TBRC 11911]